MVCRDVTQPQDNNKIKQWKQNNTLVHICKNKSDVNVANTVLDLQNDHETL